MAVFRVEKNKNYTVMSNYHLKDKNITLKAKGLLSQMLSLPDNWNYTLEGLAQLNKEKIDAIRAAVKELEGAGYIQRSRERDEKGRLGDTIYVIFEQPYHPTLENPTLDNPTLDNPTLDYPTLGNPMQLNTNIQNTKGLNTKSINPIPSPPSKPEQPIETKRKETMSTEAIEAYRDFVLENIDYDILINEVEDQDALNEIVELIVETICGSRNTIRIASNEYPLEIVRNRLFKLKKEHIQYVMDCLKKNTTNVRSVKAYLLTSLFNAPTTMANAYRSQVNFDMKEACQK